MVEKIGLSFRDLSEYQQEVNDILKTGKYGEVQKVGVDDSGSLVIETSKATVTLRPELPPPRGGDLSGALDNFGDVDELFLLMETLVKAMREMRSASSAARQVEHDAQVASLLDAAQKTRDAGAKAMIFAVVSLVVTTAVSAISVLTALKSAKMDVNKMLKAESLGETQKTLTRTQHALTGELARPVQAGLPSAASKQLAGDFNRLSTAVEVMTREMKSASTSAGLWGSLHQTLQSVAPQSGQVVGGLGQMSQAESHAEGETVRAKAEDHQFKAQKESEQVAVLQDLMRSVLEKLRTIMDLQQQAASAANRI